MLAIFVLVCEFEDEVRPLTILSRVCRKWNHLCAEPFLWDQMAKRFFVCFPLIQQLAEHGARTHDYYHGRSLSDISDRSVTPQPKQLPRGVGELIKRATPSTNSANPFAVSTPLLRFRPRFPTTQATKKSYLRRAAELNEHDQQRKHQIVVLRRHGPVLHVIVSGALFCFSLSGFIAVLALEGIEPRNTLNAENCFFFLWLTYLLVFAAITANVVMKAHFEPQPLVSRVRRHLNLIMLSVAVLFMTVLCIALPLYMVQQNVYALIEAQVTQDSSKTPTRGDWLRAASPIIAGLSLWFLEVLYSVRASLRQWFRQPEFSLTVLYDAGANCTPLFFIVALFAAVEATVTPQSKLHLAIGSAPLFVTFLTLSIVFATEYTVHQRTTDLLSGLCLGMATLFPVAVVALPLRGWTGLPIVLATSGFYLTHLSEIRRRFSALENGEVDPDASELSEAAAWPEE